MAEQEPFHARLVAAMAEMSNPVKEATASTGKFSYKYETLDQVLGTIRPALLAHGIGLTQGSCWSEERHGYVLRTEVFDAYDQQAGRVLDERQMLDASSGANAQTLGSWETYMRRYALRTAFGLCGEDDDGAATVARPVQRQQPADRRQKMISRVYELMEQRQVPLKEVEGYVQEAFGAGAIEALDEQQLVQLGKTLSAMEVQHVD